MKFIKLIYFSTFIFGAQLSNAQIIRESTFNQKIQQGAKWMAIGQYDSAQAAFRFVLDNKKKLPSDLVYYFGRNSYHIKKYKQSINWLNKYIQLKGTKGKYYEIALQYLHYAEEEYRKIIRKDQKIVQEELNSADYDCGGLSKMLCPVCRGSGVIVSDGVFGKTYKTCPYSLGEGYLSCEEYNLFMRGKLKPRR